MPDNRVLVTIDDIDYPNIIVKELVRKFVVLDGPNTERSINNGELVRDIIGTYYNYTITFDTTKANYAVYDSLYELLSSPVTSHKFVLPYGQRTHTFYGYVTSGDDNLKSVQKIAGRSTNIWSELTIEIISMGVAVRP